MVVGGWDPGTSSFGLVEDWESEVDAMVSLQEKLKLDQQLITFII